MKPAMLILLFIAILQGAYSQVLRVQVSDQHKSLLKSASVSFINIVDSSDRMIQITGDSGTAVFKTEPAKTYLLEVTLKGFQSWRDTVTFGKQEKIDRFIPVQMNPAYQEMHAVTVSGQKNFLTVKNGKTIIYVDASLTSAGSNAMEIFQNLPGVNVNRDGTIVLKGKAGVLVLVDGKPTYLSGSELGTYLETLNASQISQVELMEHPPAKYEAAGSAGIINIVTKKSSGLGQFGTLTFNYLQGRFPKFNQTLNYSLRKKRWDLSVNLHSNQFSTYLDLHAFRRYFQKNTLADSLNLDQYTIFHVNGYTHNFRTEFNYTLSENTDIGFQVSGLLLQRNTTSEGSAEWMNPTGNSDSLLLTSAHNTSKWKNLGGSLHFHHRFSKQTEINADADYLQYQFNGRNEFDNRLQGNIENESYTGNLPAQLRILSGKADISHQVSENLELEGGWKSSSIHTDNIADYLYFDGTTQVEDKQKSNHFIYSEINHAAYFSMRLKKEKWTIESGLRYEHTLYKGHQIGNEVNPDSSFTNNYGAFFPNATISYTKDSSNSFSLSVDRRIDRPAYQKLNPFVYIINKYTYQLGNPYFKPQFSWSATVSHNYKDLLQTSFTLSRISDYFSQLFYSNADGLVIYTEGNAGNALDLGLSVTWQCKPAPWWNFSLSVSVNHKTIDGTVITPIHASIWQETLNSVHQFRLGKGWLAEISGNYISRSQTDIQEIVDPTGQLACSIGKSIWNNKVSLKLGGRDLFHSQRMNGHTLFQQSDEFFQEFRDSRMVTLSISYRFGKTVKTRHTESGAQEEIQRVGAEN